MQKRYWIGFTEIEKAELMADDRPEGTPAENEVDLESIVSWISSGTETVGCYCRTHYQMRKTGVYGTGYATVSRVTAVGRKVDGVKPGDIVLGGCHSSSHRLPASELVKVPDGLSPEQAVFARMIKVSIPSFVRTGVAAPDICAVTGLGVIGFWCAQLASMFGYEVVASDPNPLRREIAAKHGIRVTEALREDDPEFSGKIGFGIDCSGNELAVKSLCDVMRNWGEISLVGVPWKPNSDLNAQKILHPVFYKFLTLKTGWEADMPGQHKVHNDLTHKAAALRYLSEGRIGIEPWAYEKVSPEDPQTLYQNILHGRLNSFGYMLDWSGFTRQGRDHEND
ncbi:MAG: zinc-binding alcohol dehydrogenase [Victivallaceae bacterium]|nr:zinc-binding alcohol dehydrogenase [Victivallaceae bacterium]